MTGVARTAQDRTGGLIIGVLAPNVYVENTPIVVQGAQITPYGDDCKAAPITGTGSSTVFANGLPVNRAGDTDICGTPISPGAGSVFAG